MSFTQLYIRFLILLLLLLGASYIFLGRPSIGIDDANIFLNYARHFSNGDGFVYNTNGERVEGFTSMLWVLVCAAFYLLSSHPEMLIMGFLLLVTCFTVTMVYTELKEDVEALPSSFIKKNFFWLYTGFLLCIGPSFITWSVLSLMENGLWTMLFVSIVLLLLRATRKKQLSGIEKTGMLVAGILLILTRPEGVAWGIIFSIVLFLIHFRNNKSYLFPLLFLLLMGATTLGLISFRLHYFGYPLPNTYYAKVSADKLYNITSGFKYMLNFIANFNAGITLLFSVLLASFGYIVITVAKNYRKGNSLPAGIFRQTIVLLVLLLGLALPLATGGDHFGGFRFYQNILLLFAWGLPAFLWLYHESVQREEKTATRLLWGAILLFFAFLSFSSVNNLRNIPKTQMDYDFFLAKDGRLIGNELNAYWDSAPPSIGVIPAGGIAVTYTGETIDLMGLNNTKMAHSKGDRKGIKNHAAFNKETFYEMNAALLLPKLMANELEARQEYMDLLKTDNFENQAMKDIFNDEKFRQAYHPVLLKKKGRTPIFGFARKNLLPELGKKPEMDLIILTEAR